jgi:hypothetical protein
MELNPKEAALQQQWLLSPSSMIASCEVIVAILMRAVH